jgi:LacI family transcriptional regulator
VAADYRLNGYRDALSARGVEADPALYIEAGPFVQGGLQIARLLDLPPRERPTAVFCFNDRVAMGAYRVARYRGLQIPTDLSIVGFDDQEFIASELDPSLTTMRLPHPEMGKLAIELLLDQPDPALDNAGNGSSVHRIPCELIRRESVASPLAGP